MENLSEQLDEVVLDIFHTLESVYKKQAELEQVMKDGFFTMARARYNIGVKRVTADQIVDANLVANRTVELNDDADVCFVSADGEAVSEKFQDLFVLCNEKRSGECSKKSSETGNDKMSKDSSLRKRGTTDLDKEFEECLKIIEGEDDKKSKLMNPINLFGVLVPQALRSSQKSFEEAIQLSVDVANDKHKLNMLQKKLDHLKQEKSKLSHLEESDKCVDKES